MEKFRTVDYHTAGEPFRIVTDLPVSIVGADVPEKRLFAMASPEVERIRRILCHEPRGHADMYGGFIVEADDAGADFGVLFWHKDGFSTACGHGSLALGIWAVESGRIAPEASGRTTVTIDVPSGRVEVHVHTDSSGAVTGADFVNVPSYVIARDVPVTTSRGELLVDIAFGGAIYAQLDAASLGLSVTAENAESIIAIGREVKWALNDSDHARHPVDDRLSGIYGTIVFEDLDGTDDAPGASGAPRAAGVPGAGPDAPAAPGLRQRNATIFADGELDRSPCGSGTCARLATLTATESLPVGAVLDHGSIVGSRFAGRVLAELSADDRPAVLPQVSGTAHLTGEHTFIVDPRDVLTPGFVLR